MLCPEVWNFPAPKVFTSSNKSEDLEPALNTVKMNYFYKSLVITCPDELQTPSFIQQLLTEDTDYYKINSCLLTEFVEPTFIEHFVKNGNLYCLSTDRNCIVDNCAAITPDGALTVHIPQYIYQTLGLEGTKRPHNFYEVKIDLKTLKNFEKVKQSLSKLEPFDFHISWEPTKEDICPSSIAKYFYDRNIKVEVKSLEHRSVVPTVTEIPSPKDVDLDEMTEWIGMLAIGGDLYPTEPFISDYNQPESEFALKTTRISVLISKGFLTPTLLTNICKNLQNYVKSREIDNYWASASIQSNENSLWQWSTSGTRMFQAQDNSCNIFITQTEVMMYSVGQLKYS